jgi:hypothetical protein
MLHQSTLNVHSLLNTLPAIPWDAPDPLLVERIAAAERAGMLGNDLAILADHNAIRIGMDLDRTSDCTGRH